VKGRKLIESSHLEKNIQSSAQKNKSDHVVITVTMNESSSHVFIGETNAGCALEQCGAETRAHGAGAAVLGLRPHGILLARVAAGALEGRAPQ
jgi:hypothetical protein